MTPLPTYMFRLSQAPIQRIVWVNEELSGYGPILEGPKGALYLSPFANMTTGEIVDGACIPNHKVTRMLDVDFRNYTLEPGANPNILHLGKGLPQIESRNAA